MVKIVSGTMLSACLKNKGTEKTVLYTTVVFTLPDTNSLTYKYFLSTQNHEDLKYMGKKGRIIKLTFETATGIGTLNTHVFV